MTIGNALKYGGMGLVADMFAPMLTGGAGKIIGALYGLFTPDARQLDQAYAPGGFGIGQPPQTTRSWSLGEVGAALFGAATILPAALGGLSRLACFSMPFPPLSIYSTPFSPAGLIPGAWQSGLIRNWGACAGWLL